MDPTGPGNPLGPKAPRLQHLRRLSRRRSTRRAEGQFVIDGPTLLAEALRDGAEVREVYAEPSADPEVLAVASSTGVPVVPVVAGALAKATSLVAPQGLASVVTRPEPARLARRGLVVVLVEVADPGNAGTLLRVAEAAGASGVVSCGDAVDPWNPKCVRASAGSIFRVPIVEADDPGATVDELRAGGMRVIALDARGVPLDRADLGGDVAVLLGNESHGLAPTLLDAVDDVVSIPMAGSVESLNVAMAGTVVAFEAARQRRAGGDGRSDAGGSEAGNRETGSSN